MKARAAGERYLRLLVETLVAEPELAARTGEPSAVRNAGDALIAAGAVEEAFVDELDADLALALAVRRRPPGTLLPLPGRADPYRRPEAGLPQAPPPRSVAAGPVSLDGAAGVVEVEAVTFGADGALVIATVHERARSIGPSYSARRAPGAGVAPLRPPAPRGSRAPFAGPGGSGERGRRRLGPSDGPSPRDDGEPWRGPAPGGAATWTLHLVDDNGRRYHAPGGVSAGTAVPGGRRYVAAVTPVPPPGIGWLDISQPGGPAERLWVTPPAGPARTHTHGRAAGETWLLGALQEHVTRLMTSGPHLPSTARLTDGARALVALDALAATDPLLVQVRLLVDRPAVEPPPDLDPRLASPLARKDAPGRAPRSVRPMGTSIDLGDRVARLDTISVEDGTLRLWGWFAPARPVVPWIVSAFDDRHHHYVGTVRSSWGFGDGSLPAGGDGQHLAWELLPALDPEARSIRLSVAGPVMEATLEVLASDPA